MTDSTASELSAFLTAEFSRNDIPIPVGGEAQWAFGEWSLNRDNDGFVVTASVEACLPLKSLLDTIFSQPHFDSGNGTLIYRNDERHVTVMLRSGKEETTLIVLLWQDPVVRARIAEAQSDALSQIIDVAISEVQGLLADAFGQENDRKSASLFDVAERKIGELVAALEQCGGQDAS